MDNVTTHRIRMRRANARRLAEKVDAWNARAKRLGAQPLDFSMSEPIVEGTPDGDVRVFVDVVVRGAPLVVAHGQWTMVGKVSAESGVLIPSAVPGRHIPLRYFCADMSRCDHCATRRQRKEVFIFERAGGMGWIQVGRSCLRDFFGRDPGQEICLASLYHEFIAEAERIRDGDGGEFAEFGIHLVLSLASAAVAANNGAFVSRAQASRDEMISTASQVLASLNPPKKRPDGWKPLEISDADRQTAESAIEWLRRQPLGASEYMHSLHALVIENQTGSIRASRLSMVVSLIGAYLRDAGQQATLRGVGPKGAHNSHVGSVGERRKFQASFVGATSLLTDYGTLYIGKFQSDDGLLVYRGGSPFWPRQTARNTQLEFVATIKAHNEYKGQRQTMIQRVKLVNH